MGKGIVVATLILGVAMAGSTKAFSDDELKIGIIGTDTSHCTAFTKLFNDKNDKGHIEGGRVVAAFKGGSPDIESSASRVEGYAKELQNKYGVEIVDNIDELLKKVDVVLLESVDGRPHLDQAKPVFAAKKTVFIDKPVAGTLRDALAIYDLAKENNVPVFTSSAYRYYDSMVELKKQDIGNLRGAISYGPSELEPHHPDLFWYGVHATEALFTAMGTGCQSVVRTSTPDTDVVTGTWSDGKVGTFVGLRNQFTPHKVIMFGTKAVAAQEDGKDDYRPLVVEIMNFFKTGKAPVASEETIEIFAFMEAADESKRRGGEPVTLAEVMEKARKPAEAAQ